MGLPHFLTVSAALFALGLFAVMSRRNAVAILMGVELMLNAANLNFVAFSRYVQHGIDGQILAAFVIVLAAAEAAVALAIVLALYRNYGSVHADTAQSLKR
ncbi:MAG: NADH-quinone oxidoreductase subunit NuoK [bacterium]|nr:NADH-quinone oxidoreductase subunit NuoK [bacterium]MBK7771667.1 NADH-quinone oxidoreductase subunit NuoK [bacterium]MBK9776350.1 NADH-quinone oxidoreductase subunit NuoK [bacterium]